MGCCNSERFKMDQEMIVLSIKQAISQGEIRRLDIFLRANIPSTGKPIDINEAQIIAGENMQLNIPAFAILTGNLKVFQYLSKSFIISIEKVNQIFEKYHTSAISIICLNGYADFLQYYLPICLEFNSIDKSVNDLNTLNFSEIKETVTHVYTPIQLACFKANVNCINIILNYFKNKQTPWWLDLNYIDPVYGENCALVACKSGKYKIMRYLFLYTEANFHVLNTNNENALQVFLSSAKRQHIPDQLSVVKFLIEDVKIDIKHHIEETLLLCECYECIDYLNGKIKELGIEITKVELEADCEIKPLKAVKKERTIVIDRSIESTIRDQENTYSLNFSNVSKFL